LNPRVFACLVTHNPNIDLLKKSIHLVTSQVDKIFIIDNASSNSGEIRNTFDDFVSIHFLAENIGLSKAYNIGIESAINGSFEYIIFLDQDSLLQPSAIDKLLLGFEYSDSVSAVVPSIKDANSGHLTTVVSEFEKIDKIINSGSMFRVSYFKTIGLFDESLFVDFVDVEISLRMRGKGFSILRSRNALLIHELGNSFVRNFLFFKFNVTNHSPFRRFLISKNRIIVYRKYFSVFPLFLLKDVFSFIKMFVSILLFEENKFKKEQSIILGIIAGFRVKF
jgi:rhamnosyltransferase